jgi:hypothetical protein
MQRRFGLSRPLPRGSFGAILRAQHALGEGGAGHGGRYGEAEQQGRGEAHFHISQHSAAMANPP